MRDTLHVKPILMRFFERPQISPDMLKTPIQVINSTESDHYFLYAILICLLTAIGLTFVGSSIVHTYTQTIQSTKQFGCHPKHCTTCCRITINQRSIFTD
jgi:hypothetical protein